MGGDESCSEVELTGLLLSFTTFKFWWLLQDRTWASPLPCREAVRAPLSSRKETEHPPSPMTSSLVRCLWPQL